MRKKIVPLLRSGTGGPLELHSYADNGEHVAEGILREDSGYWYPIIDGVPSFLRGQLRPSLGWFQKKHQLPVLDDDEQDLDNAREQLRTNPTFSDKWRRFKNYGLEDTHKEFLFDWYCKKFGLANVDELKNFYSNREYVLEVGPGSGFNSLFIAENTSGDVFALDISEAALTTYENTSHLSNCHTVQADLMEAPFDDNFFDLIIADGVLHHTPDTKKAVSALYRKLKPGGQFFFHVYRKMGPARYFCDNHIREAFASMDPEDCYKACEGLTELGRALSKLNVTVTLEQEIPILGIPPGEHDVQRLIYYNFLKCFWNEAFDFETNNMVNFDWYHPYNAWQHTQDEVKGWLQELNVTDYAFNPANPNGISVLLSKPSE